VSARTLTAPFPWFGGKSAVAPAVWAAIGDVPNYVEPFFGSGAVLLARPHAPRVETVNDADGMLANFWRAVAADPEAVARHADWPVNELDVHARNRWLMGEREAITAQLRADPRWFDAEAAGWWCWGQCSSILGNWMSRKGSSARPDILGNSTGRGVHRLTATPREAMLALHTRLRRVRVLCRDFAEALAPAVLLGDLSSEEPVGVFLDPPYSPRERDGRCYGPTDDASASARARAWCLGNGEDPRLRIVLCGYEGEHAMPPSWRSVPWSAHGGMAHLGRGETRGKKNKDRERLWLSPACLRTEQLAMFDLGLAVGTSGSAG
jgi:DNA adenine methylase